MTLDEYKQYVTATRNASAKEAFAILLNATQTNQTQTKTEER